MRCFGLVGLTGSLAFLVLDSFFFPMLPVVLLLSTGEMGLSRGYESDCWMPLQTYLPDLSTPSGTSLGLENGDGKFSINLGGLSLTRRSGFLRLCS